MFDLLQCSFKSLNMVGVKLSQQSCFLNYVFFFIYFFLKHLLTCFVCCVVSRTELGSEFLNDVKIFI